MPGPQKGLLRARVSRLLLDVDGAALGARAAPWHNHAL
jgi:hypothetical protein